MEQYTKYLKDKKVIFGLIVAVLILFNAIKGCGTCGNQDDLADCGSDVACEKE